MRVGDRAVALDVPDDAAGVVPDLNTPPVARVVFIRFDFAVKQKRVHSAFSIE